MNDRPIRPAREIALLRTRCHALEQRVINLEHTLAEVLRLQDAIEQFHAILECGEKPAPIFLRWSYSDDDGCTVAKASFGQYHLDVVNGKNAVSWSITKGKTWVAAGGGHTSFDLGLDEVETALRRIVQGSPTPATGE